MKTFISKYQLKKKSTLNAKDQSAVQYGALIRLEDENKNWGVADLKPWPTLGDANLDQELKTKSTLFQRSLFLAEKDLIARKNKISLLKPIGIKNNFLITKFKDVDLKKINSTTIKVKASKNLHELEIFLNELENLDLKIRIDLNAAIDSAEFEGLIYSLSDKVLNKIEYIEDPSVEIDSNWFQWNKKVPLAVDFSKGKVFDNLNAWTYLIIKPARQNSDKLIEMCLQENKKFTLTSAMDHPVGLAHGLSYAQNFPQQIHGFGTLHLYEETEFNKYFLTDQDQLQFSKIGLNEYGIGMNDILENLNWAPL